MSLDPCDYLIFTNITVESSGKKTRIVGCGYTPFVENECPYPARYCAHKHQNDKPREKNINGNYTIVLVDEERLK